MAVCLVTGGADFIGSHLVEALTARDHLVRVLDNLNPATHAHLSELSHRIELIHGDLTDYRLVQDATRGVDFVFYQPMLGPQSHDVADVVQSHQNFTTGLLHVLTAARDAGVRRLIYASSSRVYGDLIPRPLRETDPTLPSSPYAVMELAGEQHCAAFTCLYGLETVRLRYFNIFGPRQSASSPCSSIVFHILKAMLADQRPTIFGSGLEPHDVLFVDDVVHANLLAIAGPRVSGKVYNIARGRPTTALEIVAIINRLLDAQVQPVHNHFPRPEGYVYNQADIARAETELGFCPCTDLEWGLRRCLEYYAERQDELAFLNNPATFWS